MKVLPSASFTMAGSSAVLITSPLTIGSPGTPWVGTTTPFTVTDFAAVTVAIGVFAAANPAIIRTKRKPRDIFKFPLIM
jgi:hypothetical protein